jgi:competence protein ComEA
MAIGRYLQDNFGFTRNELTVLLVLAAITLAGAALRFITAREPASVTPPRLTGSDTADSLFAARARTLHTTPPAADDNHRTSRNTHPRPSPAPGEIDINAAGRDALMRLPGIGPVYADRILAYRSTNGPFRRVDDLLNVRGIGPKTLERLRPFLRVAAGPHP